MCYKYDAVGQQDCVSRVRRDAIAGDDSTGASRTQPPPVPGCSSPRAGLYCSRGSGTRLATGLYYVYTKMKTIVMEFHDVYMGMKGKAGGELNDVQKAMQGREGRQC